MKYPLKILMNHKFGHIKKVMNSYRSKTFDYSLHYKKLNLRKKPDLYKVGVKEQGVLLVEPYKSEILPLWRFKTPAIAKESALAIYQKFLDYKNNQDFIGMDMARKFLQMGFTRSRRYANHKSGRKYSEQKKESLPFENDLEKAKSAEIFARYWEMAEEDKLYSIIKIFWKKAFG